ncbi:hypothetical protein ABID39_000062 [Bartonella japonica]|uniref:Uncharacterized protein n=1 Tax=Bartonella japonica TaxID=357761 RepID=A0ABV2FLH1_9HYPH
MDHEEFFICVSAITAVPFFSSITEIGNWGVKALLHSSDFYKSAVKSKYKPPLYKLWQYVIKDKPSTYNSGIVYFDDKGYPHIRQVLASYLYPSERLKQCKNYAKQLASLSFKKRLSFKDILLFRKYSSHTIGRRHMLDFFPCVHVINQTSSHVKNILGKCQTYSHRVCCKLNNFTSRYRFTSYYRNVVYQRLEKAHRIGVYINKIFSIRCIIYDCF